MFSKEHLDGPPRPMHLVTAPETRYMALPTWVLISLPLWIALAVWIFVVLPRSAQPPQQIVQPVASAPDTSLLLEVQNLRQELNSLANAVRQAQARLEKQQAETQQALTQAGADFVRLQNNTATKRSVEDLQQRLVELDEVLGTTTRALSKLATDQRNAQEALDRRIANLEAARAAATQVPPSTRINANDMNDLELPTRPKGR